MPVALSIDPAQATLVMTNAHRRPTVALHTTESFDGVVLHDPVLWHSTNPSVSDVSPTGLVTGYSKGTTVINATIGHVSVSAPITVVDNTTTTTVAQSQTHEPGASTHRAAHDHHGERTAQHGAAHHHDARADHHHVAAHYDHHVAAHHDHHHGPGHHTADAGQP